MRCASCGRESAAEFRFCPECGAPAGAAPAAVREQRKVVTVLFCDVTGSTALGERLDPEALRALLARYFERMKAIVESHGGTVEKFIGDAVMAVFGVPALHEDDALRACRAAVEMRDAFGALGVQGRIGVTTGEVVTGTEERLATGDPVNVAARLEQAAAPGEVLIGVETERLVADAVEVEPVEPLVLKGKAEPVGAFRLLAVTGELVRRHAAPMVGRERQRRLLTEAFHGVCVDRSCQLFTVLGAAGVGKSRLVAEFLDGLDATVVRGRCPSYGEGIAYWPVVEVLKQLGLEPDDPAAAAAVRVVLGESDEPTTAPQVVWAVRKTLEQAAGEQPLVVVWDDLHWGDEAFLDLVEHVADLSREAPILLLCMARPELLERRAGWAGGKLNATTVLLEPLSPAETEELIDRLGAVEPELRARIREAAEGNPLFVEEMLALAAESGGDVVVPPSIQALLAARLDQLASAERAVLECGSVEGRVFHRGALVALTDGSGAVDERLVALVRKELLRPDRPQLPGEDAYRFRHLLIRDAAYEALPKAQRAELHERFADWLEGKVGERKPEYEAVIGHHLGEAYRFRSELGMDDRGLAERAGHALALAGWAALARGDAHGALALFARAVGLPSPDRPERDDLLIGLGHAAFEAGDYGRSSEAAERLIRLGRARGDSRLEHRGRMQAIWIRTFNDPTVTVDELEAAARAAIPVLTTAQDESGLARAYHLLGHVHHMRSNSEEHIAALEQALEHAHRAGDTTQEAELMSWLAVDYFFGPTPVEQAEARLEQMLDHARSKSIASLEGVTLGFLGGLAGLRGRFDQARELFRQGRAILAELDLKTWLAGQSQMTGYVEWLAGDCIAAEREYRFGYDEYERIGETSIRSTNAAMLAEALYEQGRADEAEPYLELCRETAPAEDYSSQVGWRTTTARILARRGDLYDAERIAREAVALVGQGTAIIDPSAWSSLGEVLALAGKQEQAQEAFACAVKRHEQKGNTAGAARTRQLSEHLGIYAT